MSTNPERFYFIDNNRLALVEKNGIITTDGASTPYKTISVAKSLRVNTICRANHFDTGSTAATGNDYSSEILGPLGEIPIQFHEALVFKVIAMGYKTPPGMQIELAQYFDTEYASVVKEAKKFSKRNYIQTGMIAPVDF